MLIDIKDVSPSCILIVISAVAVCMVICTDTLPLSVAFVMESIVASAAFTVVFMIAFVDTSASKIDLLFFHLLIYIILLIPCKFICLIDCYLL